MPLPLLEILLAKLPVVRVVTGLVEAIHVKLPNETLEVAMLKVATKNMGRKCCIFFIYFFGGGGGGGEWVLIQWLDRGIISRTEFRDALPSQFLIRIDCPSWDH